MKADPRITLARPDLADARLEGILRAERFALPSPRQCAAPLTALRADPRVDAEQVSQLLFGERFDVLEETNGFGWGQARRDGYVGYAPLDHLAPAGNPATHWICARATHAFAGPSIKAPAAGTLSFGAMVAITEESEALALAPAIGWIARTHLMPVGMTLEDPAAVAEGFLGAPYLWGGRGSDGLDCSGLVQQALFACGRACPRDTYQQATLGSGVAREDLARGDLVFWRGHVGIMLDAARLIHANAYHMAVAIEPFADAATRISARGGGEPTAFRRAYPCFAKI